MSRRLVLGTDEREASRIGRDERLRPEMSLNFELEAGPPSNGRTRSDNRAADRERVAPVYYGAPRRRMPFGEPEPKPVPRPAWMDDPSLLPKRPPGAP